MFERGYWVSTLFVSKLKSTVVQGTQIWLELIWKIFYFSIKLDCAPLHFVNVELKAVRVKSSPCSKFSDNLRVLLNPFNPRRESQDSTCHTNVPGKQPKRRLPHGNTLLMCIRSLLGALQNNTLLEIINLLLLMQRKTGSTASDGGNGEGRGVQNVAQKTQNKSVRCQLTTKTCQRRHYWSLICPFSQISLVFLSPNYELEDITALECSTDVILRQTWLPYRCIATVTLS